MSITIVHPNVENLQSFSDLFDLEKLLQSDGVLPYSLLATPAPQVAAVAVAHAPEAATEPNVVSLKTISKNFWRHL
ncbi:MAG: hypothetical protein V7L00_19890 [Nostoc sp.]|uniref:hypothetical protein n=1 Tax=Nostoc sp. TaxID=1180 RepID=UPI002FF5A341